MILFLLPLLLILIKFLYLLSTRRVDAALAAAVVPTRKNEGHAATAVMQLFEHTRFTWWARKEV
jgi:hypothetical protein